MIYPHSLEDMVSRNVTDTDLEAILDTVHLKYIVKRDGGKCASIVCLLQFYRFVSHIGFRKVKVHLHVND